MLKENEHKINWYKELKVIAQKYNLDIHSENVTAYNKSEWKSYINYNIEKLVKEQKMEKTKEYTKLRILKLNTTDGIQDYVTNCNPIIITEILKMKLNMSRLKANYTYTDIKCRLCNNDDESTEHIFNCKKLTKIIKMDWNNTETMKEMIKHVKWFESHII